MIIDHKNDPDKVEMFARELLDLVPDILELLIAEAENAPAL